MDAAMFYTQVLQLPSPYPHQQTLFDLLTTAPPPATFLRAPCGSGKTEAAVAPFLAQFRTQHFVLAPRLIYVLPTRALCDSLTARLARYAAATDARLVVTAHHGAHPAEPFFFSDIVVTTLDQFIYAYARARSHLGSSGVGRHLDLPAGAIASAFVVFDEAHLYEPYAHALMRAMVEMLYAAHVPFLFMTATMPESLRTDYGARVSFTPVVYTPPAPAVPLRRITLELYDQPLLLPKAVASEPWLLSSGARQRLTASSRCLLVLNTVARAQAAYRILRQIRDDVLLVHARFTVADRRRLEQEVAQRLGRHGRGGIVVATQVCEVGLDISADLILTELAPADALVQRAGRCVRFGGAGQIVVFAAEPPPYDEAAVATTSRYLHHHPQVALADWDATRALVDILPYQADDLAASDSLNDLYDATLFADARPQRLSVRQGKPLYLYVPEGNNNSADTALRERLISVDIRQAGLVRPLLKHTRGKPIRLAFDAERGLREEPSPGPDLHPFATYVMSHDAYNSELGVVWS